MREHREYKVVLNIVKQVSYIVTARTPEEAESIADDYLAEGEAPAEEELLDVAIEDVFPVEGEELAVDYDN